MTSARWPVVYAGFDPVAGANNDVHVVVPQTDGKILVGGEFIQFNGQTVNRITRLNSDGTMDPGFSAAAGFNSTVEAIAVQTDGKIPVGGQFSLANNLGRWPTGPAQCQWLAGHGF